MPEGSKRDPAGQVQSSVMVVNPAPVKKTNVPRKGKRTPMNPARS